MREPPPTRVFCRKSVDLLDCKGVDFFESDKESATVCEQRSWRLDAIGDTKKSRR